MNSSLCVPNNISYYDSPTFLKLTLHIICAVSTPIYLIAFYCILYKTPSQMKAVKPYLLTLHIWVVLLDYSVCLFAVPYIVLIAYGWIPYGLWQDLGVPPILQAINVLGVFAYMIISIISIYENRFFILCHFRFKSTWAKLRRPWLIFHHLLIVLLFVPVILILPDQEKARKFVYQLFSCLTFNQDLFIFTFDYTYHISACWFAVLLFAGEFACFVLGLLYNGFIQSQLKNISHKTYQMHKQFIIALLIQTTIPFFMLLLPLAFAGFTMLFNYFHQAPIHGCVIFAMTHGFVTTSVMLIVHKPYRLAVSEMIRGKRKKQTLIVSISK